MPKKHSRSHKGSDQGAKAAPVISGNGNGDPNGDKEGNGDEMTFIPWRAGSPFKYLVTLGVYGPWRKRHTTVVTTRRILLGRGIFNREERSIPLRHVDGVHFARRLLNSYALVTYNNRGQYENARLGPFSSRTARKLTSAISDRLDRF